MTGPSFDSITAALVVAGVVVAVAITVRRIKLDGPPKWDPHPPNVRERIIAGIWLFAFLTALANDYAGWRLFDGYDNWVVLGMLLGGLVLIQRLPGVTHTR